MNKNKRGVTLVELLITAAMLSVVIVTFYLLINNIARKKAEEDAISKNILKIAEIESYVENNIMNSSYMTRGDYDINSLFIEIYKDYVQIKGSAGTHIIEIQEKGSNSTSLYYQSAEEQRKWTLEDKTCVISNQTYTNLNLRKQDNVYSFTNGDKPVVDTSIDIVLECKDTANYNKKEYIKFPLYFSKIETISYIQNLDTNYNNTGCNAIIDNPIEETISLNEFDTRTISIENDSIKTISSDERFDISFDQSTRNLTVKQKSGETYYDSENITLKGNTDTCNDQVLGVIHVKSKSDCPNNIAIINNKINITDKSSDKLNLSVKNISSKTIPYTINISNSDFKFQFGPNNLSGNIPSEDYNISIDVQKNLAKVGDSSSYKIDATVDGCNRDLGYIYVNYSDYCSTLKQEYQLSRNDITPGVNNDISFTLRADDSMSSTNYTISFDENSVSSTSPNGYLKINSTNGNSGTDKTFIISGNKDDYSKEETIDYTLYLTYDGCAKQKITLRITTSPRPIPVYTLTKSTGGEVYVKSNKLYKDQAATQVLTSLGSASQSGYEFKGWYTASSGGTKISIDSNGTILTPNINSNMTIYPHFSVLTYTISFDSNGGKGSMSSQTCNYNSNCKLNSNKFSKTGYTFQGWSMNKSGSASYSDGESVQINANVTLYAVWKKKSCLIKGTKVLLADGSYKNIEDINYNDLLMVFDHESGKISYNYPIWIEKEQPTSSYIKITFEDDTILNVDISGHSVFSADLNKYINVLDDEFKVGSQIYKYSDGKLIKAKVKKIEIVNEDTYYYNIITTSTYNFFANDILTQESFINVATNLYGFTNNLKYGLMYDLVKVGPKVGYDYFKEKTTYHFYIGAHMENTFFMLGKNFDEQVVKDFTLYSGIEPYKIEDKNAWMVTTSLDKVNSDNYQNYLIKEGSTYRLPANKKVKCYLNTFDNKCYKPGDELTVNHSLHFIAEYK